MDWPAFARHLVNSSEAKGLPRCAEWGDVKSWPGAAPSLTYLAVARTGSGSLHAALHDNFPERPHPHDHSCSLGALEARGARRVVVSLRHPLERTSSGVQRRVELPTRKQSVFMEAFAGVADGRYADAYVGALRDTAHPKHADAHRLTYGEFGAAYRQTYMVPVVRYYLADGRGLAQLDFLCTAKLTAGFNALAARAGLPRRMNATPPPAPFVPRRHRKRDRNPNAPQPHVSAVASSEPAAVLARFAPENARWLAHTYRDDLLLFRKHCHDPYPDFGVLPAASRAARVHTS